MVSGVRHIFKKQMLWIKSWVSEKEGMPLYITKKEAPGAETATHNNLQTIITIIRTLFYNPDKSMIIPKIMTCLD